MFCSFHYYVFRRNCVCAVVCSLLFKAFCKEQNECHLNVTVRSFFFLFEFPRPFLIRRLLLIDLLESVDDVSDGLGFAAIWPGAMLLLPQMARLIFRLLIFLQQLLQSRWIWLVLIALCPLIFTQLSFIVFNCRHKKRERNTHTKTGYRSSSSSKVGNDSSSRTSERKK